jgi:hypothetical protein
MNGILEIIKERVLSESEFKAKCLACLDQIELVDARKLSRIQLRALESAVQRGEPVALSAISLLEIAVLSSGEKPLLKVPLDEFFEDLKVRPGQPFIRSNLKPCGRGEIGRRNGLKRKLECSPGNRRCRTAQIRENL